MTIIEKVRAAIESTETIQDLTNALYGPGDGVLVTSFPCSESRAAFCVSHDYVVVRSMIKEAFEKREFTKQKENSE